MTIEALLRHYTSIVATCAPGSPRADVEVLLSHLLNVSRTHLFVHNTNEVQPEVASRLDELVTKRCQGVPIAYLIGQREFYGHSFFVNEAVLIPRPETELLVEISLELLSQCSAAVLPGAGECRRFLDLCTGSGCVAISLALALASRGLNWQAVATDISPAALGIAQANACALQIDHRVMFYLGDLFDSLSNASPSVGSGSSSGVSRFALIVANPPYIGRLEGPQPEKEVVAFEPELALFAGSSGLDIIERIIEQAPCFLLPGGYLAMEIGCEQAASVTELLQVRGFRKIVVREDLAGLPRVVFGQWPGADA